MKKSKRNAHFCEFDHDLDSYYSNKLKIGWLKYVTIDKNNPKTSMYKSIVALNKSKKYHVTSKWWYIVHPMSFFFMIWESSMALVFFFQLLCSPFFMTWQKDLFFRYSSDLLKVLCMSNIAMTFFVGYINKQKDKVELNPRRIAWHYICVRGYFFMEVIAAFPFTMSFVESIDSKRVVKSFSWTCMFSLFYIYLLLQYSRTTMMYFNLSAQCYRIYRLILITILFFHWLSCLNCNEYIIFSYREQSYISLSQKQNISNCKIYWRCFFQTTSLITRLGFGLEGATNKRSVSPNLMTFIVGIVFYFYVFGELICLDYSIIQPKAKYEIQLKQLDEFMRQRKLPRRLQKRIKNYYEFKFQRKYFQKFDIISSLSPRLREEIVVSSRRHLLQKSVLFKKVPRTALTRLLNCLKEDVYFPNDLIIKCGSYGDCMFFLASGTVAVISRLGKEIVHLHDGAFFGELALVMENEKRVTSVIAVEFCEVFRLDREDFERILSPHRKIFNEITHLVVDRVAHSPIVGDPQQPMTI